MESMAYGEEVPMPSEPRVEFQVRVVVPGLPKRTVEDAERPPWSDRRVPVALATAPKDVPGVNSNGTGVKPNSEEDAKE